MESNNLSTDEKLRIMQEVSTNIIGYLQDEFKVNTDALKAYDSPITDSDAEVKKIREIEAVKLRDRINELARHISVIKRMYPDVKN